MANVSALVVKGEVVQYYDGGQFSRLRSFRSAIGLSDARIIQASVAEKDTLEIALPAAPVDRTDISIDKDAPTDATKATLYTAAGSFSSLAPGQSVTTTGFTESANNGSFTVESVADDGLSMVIVRDSGAFVDESSGESISISTKRHLVVIGGAKSVNFFTSASGTTISLTLPFNGVLCTGLLSTYRRMSIDGNGEPVTVIVSVMQ